MYPDITKFREQVIKYTNDHSYNHLGLGLRLYSSDVEKEARTVFNASSQFWSILTLLAMGDLYDEIDKNGLQDDVFINSTIYDALYGYVKNDEKTIQWLNNTIVPIMTTQWLVDQIVPNEAELEIGRSWADLNAIPNNVDITTIKEILSQL